jgi:hypothetical protein
VRHLGEEVAVHGLFLGLDDDLEHAAEHAPGLRQHLVQRQVAGRRHDLHDQPALDRWLDLHGQPFQQEAMAERALPEDLADVAVHPDNQLVVPEFE